MQRKFRTYAILAVAVLGVFALPATAWGDEIVNNLDGSRDAAREPLNLTVPTTGSTTIVVHPVTGDGDPGCNFQPGGGTVTFGVASSNTLVATVSPTSFTFDACADSQAVTVTPLSAGSADITFTVTNDATAGTWSALPANFTVNVSGAANHAPTVSIDAQDVNGNEGDTLMTNGAFADQDGDQLTITRDSGAGTVTPGSGGSWSWSLATTDDASGTVVVKADDGKGGTATDSFKYTAVNVPPTINGFTVTGNNTTACVGGNEVGVSYTVTDPADNTADPINTAFTWGDGSLLETIAGRDVSATHTYAPGIYSLSVTADDGDNGTDTENASISHLYSTVGGFPLPPLNADNSSNFKLGSTIPVKLRVTDCNGVSVGSLAPKVNLTRTSSSTSGNLNEEVLVVSNPDVGNTMRYDATAGQYIYNLSTKRSSFANDGPLQLGHYKLTVSDTLIASRSVEFDILR
jgi:hypothetical protein